MSGTLEKTLGGMRRRRRGVAGHSVTNMHFITCLILAVLPASSPSATILTHSGVDEDLVTDTGVTPTQPPHFFSSDDVLKGDNSLPQGSISTLVVRTLIGNNLVWPHAIAEDLTYCVIDTDNILSEPAEAAISNPTILKPITKMDVMKELTDLAALAWSEAAKVRFRYVENCCQGLVDPSDDGECEYVWFTIQPYRKSKHASSQGMRVSGESKVAGVMRDWISGKYGDLPWTKSTSPRPTRVWPVAEGKDWRELAREAVVYVDPYMDTENTYKTLVHELGHTLGFAHEFLVLGDAQSNSDNGSGAGASGSVRDSEICKGNDDEYGVSIVHPSLVRQVGFDELSVMGYAMCSGKGGHRATLSERDRLGAAHVYGLPKPGNVSLVVETLELVSGGPVDLASDAVAAEVSEYVSWKNIHSSKTSTDLDNSRSIVVSLRMSVRFLTDTFKLKPVTDLQLNTQQLVNRNPRVCADIGNTRNPNPTSSNTLELMDHLSSLEDTFAFSALTHALRASCKDVDMAHRVCEFREVLLHVATANGGQLPSSSSAVVTMFVCAGEGGTSRTVESVKVFGSPGHDALSVEVDPASGDFVVTGTIYLMIANKGGEEVDSSGGRQMEVAAYWDAAVMDISTKVDVITTASKGLKERVLVGSTLYLSGMGLTSETALETLTALSRAEKSTVTDLQLSQNLFNEMPTHVFKELPNLTSVDLSGNTIRSVDVCGNGELATLRLAHNQIRTITCSNADSPLTRLDLRHNKLDIVSLAFLNSTRHLQELLLASNSIRSLTGLDVDTVSTSLKFLDLGHNWIHSLPPRMWRALSRLETLDLSSNLLSTLPDCKDSTVNSPNMRELKLQRNQFGDAGAVDSILGRCFPYLATLDMSHNRLTQLHLENLHHLKTFTANTNALRELSLGQSVMLQTLSVENNAFVSPPAMLSQSLPRMTYLSLRNNKLDGPLHLGDAPTLSHLVVTGNAITRISFEGAPRLAALDASNNRLTDIEELLSSAKALRELQIDDNAVEDLPPSLEGLQVLSVKRNRLLRLSTESASLSELHANDNMIQHISSSLPKLSRVNLARNSLKSLDLTSLGSLSFDFIDVSSNNITLVSRNAHDITTVRHLEVQDNQLTHLDRPVIQNSDYVDASMNLMKELNLVDFYDTRVLKVAQNQLESLFVDWDSIGLTHDSARLEYLDLRHNRLTSLPTSLTENLPRIHTVKLVGSGLKPPLDSDKSGEELLSLFPSTFSINYEEYDLRELPMAARSASLTHVSIVRSNLHTLPVVREHQMWANTTWVALRDNHIQIIPRWLFDLPRLTSLDIGPNPIQRLQLSSDPLKAPLEQLWLDGTSITSIPESIVRIPSLRVLHLKSCKLTSLPPAITHSSLYFIDVSSNPLKKFPPIPSLRKLRASLTHLRSLPSDFPNILHVEATGSDLERLSLCAPKLGHLSVAFNKLTDITFECRINSSVLVLEVYGNRISGFPPSLSLDSPHYMLSHSSFVLVDLTRNNITYVPRISGCIQISDNPIERFADVEICMPRKFGYDSHFSLSGTPLTKLPRLAHSPDTLSFQDNHLDEFPPQFLEAPFQRTVSIISLKNNNISVLPSDIIKLRKLQGLDVARNALTLDSFRDLKLPPRLRSLDLSHNPITSVPICVQTLPRLRTLVMVGCGLTQLPDRARMYNSLQSINLAHNSLKGTPPQLWEFRRVKRLILSHNNIGTVNLSSLRASETVELTHNNITTFPLEPVHAQVSLAGNPFSQESLHTPMMAQFVSSCAGYEDCLADRAQTLSVATGAPAVQAVLLLPHIIFGRLFVRNTDSGCNTQFESLQPKGASVGLELHVTHYTSSMLLYTRGTIEKLTVAESGDEWWSLEREGFSHLRSWPRGNMVVRSGRSKSRVQLFDKGYSWDVETDDPLSALREAVLSGEVPQLVEPNVIVDVGTGLMRCAKYMLRYHGSGQDGALKKDFFIFAQEDARREGSTTRWLTRMVMIDFSHYRLVVNKFISSVWADLGVISFGKRYIDGGYLLVRSSS